jgi:hypothetical protein
VLVLVSVRSISNALLAFVDHLGKEQSVDEVVGAFKYAVNNRWTH